MEWCLRLNDDRTIMFERFRRSVLVLTVLCFVIIMCETGGTGVKTSTGSVSVSLGSAEGLRNEDVPEISTVQEDKPTFPILSQATSVETVPVIPDMPDVEKAPISSETANVETVPVMPETPEAETVPVMPETPEAEIVPVMPEIPDADAMSGQGDKIYSDSISESQTEAVVPNVVDGFYIDDEGMITGIADQSVISNGYLELPAEGCTGIRSGAFFSSADGIRELYIPANISCIEIGAFAGMWQLEWIEKESSGGCYTEDGVLFSENGACILAFPASRTGSYKVPAHVTTIALDAFSGAQITILDSMGAQITDMGNFPENIEII